MKPKNPKIEVTKSYIEKAKPGTTTIDAKQDGLRLVVSPEGRRVWEFYAAIPGTKNKNVRKRFAVAGFDGIPVETARRRASAMLDELHTTEGKAKASASKVPTIGDIVDSRADDWLTEHIDRHFEGWRTKRLDEVTPEMVAAQREAILKRARRQSLKRNPDQKDPGEATVGLAAKALRQVYKQANERGLYKGENAGQWLPLHKGGVRRVWLKDDDMLLDLEEALDNWERNGLPVWSKPYYLLQLLTGSRGGVLAKARWDWVDWKTKEIHLPDTDTKTDEPNVLHLDLEDDKALKLLEAWREATKERGSPFIFPSVRDARKSMTNMHGNAWKPLRDVLGWDDINPHDLRRTYGSRLLNAGVPIEVVSKLMGHKSIAVTQRVYAHLLNKTLKAALASVSAPSRKN